MSWSHLGGIRRSVFLSCVGRGRSVTSRRSGGEDHCPLFGAAASFAGLTVTCAGLSAAAPAGTTTSAGAAGGLLQAPVRRRQNDAEEVAVRCLLLSLGVESEVRRGVFVTHAALVLRLTSLKDAGYIISA